MHENDGPQAAPILEAISLATNEKIQKQCLQDQEVGAHETYVHLFAKYVRAGAC
jgi:hypothetical protein